MNITINTFTSYVYNSTKYCAPKNTMVVFDNNSSMPSGILDLNKYAITLAENMREWFNIDLGSIISSDEIATLRPEDYERLYKGLLYDHENDLGRATLYKHDDSFEISFETAVGYPKTQNKIVYVEDSEICNGFEIWTNRDTKEVLHSRLIFANLDFSSKINESTYKGFLPLGLFTDRYTILKDSIDNLDTDEQSKEKLQHELNEAFKANISHYSALTKNAIIDKSIIFRDLLGLPYKLNGMDSVKQMDRFYQEFGEAFVDSAKNNYSTNDIIAEAFKMLSQRWNVFKMVSETSHYPIYNMY